MIFNFIGSTEKEDYSKNLGPGRYNVKLSMRKTNAGFSMKSRETRMKAKVNPNPAPDKYKIPRNMLKRKPFKINGPMSSFAKSVRKKELNIREKEKVKDKLQKGRPLKAYRGAQEEPLPGPGDYNGAEAKDFNHKRKPVSIKGSSFFLKGPKRFQLDKQKVKNPGPGTYKGKSGFDMDKYHVFGAAFMSETERKVFNIKKANDRFTPYDPVMKPKKESFHFNIKAKPRFIP